MRRWRNYEQQHGAWAYPTSGAGARGKGWSSTGRVVTIQWRAWNRMPRVNLLCCAGLLEEIDLEAVPGHLGVTEVRARPVLVGKINFMRPVDDLVFVSPNDLVKREYYRVGYHWVGHANDRSEREDSGEDVP